MVTLIIIVAIVLIVNSISTFNSMTRNAESLLKHLNDQISDDPNNYELKFKKAECLINLQRYDSAWEEYGKIIKNQSMLKRFRNEIVRDSEHNIQFCIKPLPWSTRGPKDLSGSFIHYIMLKNFGNSVYKTAFNLR